MPALTAATVTDKQIRDLRAEAVRAGDWRQVDICDVALGIRHQHTATDRGSIKDSSGRSMTRPKSRSACAKVISYAQAASDSGRTRHHATKKKSPNQLDREIAAALHGSSGEKSDVMIVTNVKDWHLLEETLALDAESAAFERTLREQIGEALDAVEVGTTHQGRKVVVRARAKDWELLRETLRVDALSKRIPRHERDDLQAALNRLVIKPWPH